MSELTLQVILFSIFSRDLDDQIKKTGVNPFALVSQVTSRDLQFALKFRSLSKDINEIIDLRLAENRSEKDFLSMLMESTDKETGEQMSRKQLLDEVMTLVVAGHETTAIVLNWAWHAIANNPDISEMLYQEAKYLNGNPPQFEDLSSLTYTRQVLEESMRLYPPAWLITRKALKEDHLGEYFIPAGTDIFISPYLVQRSPQFWDHPEVFDPSRFDPKNAKDRHRFVYFPFGGGPRQCIGDYFSIVEMQIHLAFFIQYIKLEYLDQKPIELVPQVNLRTKHDLFMMPVRR